MFMFPYDTQICSLEFGNVIETDLFVNVTRYPDNGSSLIFYSESNEFVLKSMEARRRNWQVRLIQSK